MSDRDTTSGPAGEELVMRPRTAEEMYFLEQAYKEPVEGIARIEEAAKFLVGATATTSGLFVAAYKLSLGEATASGTLWFAPFVLWAAGILAFLAVLYPQKYAVGRREPESWKQAFLTARRCKYRWLCCGAVFFIAGICVAALPLT